MSFFSIAFSWVWLSSIEVLGMGLEVLVSKLRSPFPPNWASRFFGGQIRKKKCKIGLRRFAFLGLGFEREGLAPVVSKSSPRGVQALLRLGFEDLVDFGGFS